MSTFFRGGWSKVEFATDQAMTTPTEIPNILKDGTGIKFETPVEALGNDNEASTGKKGTVEIRSSDLTAGTYTALIAAEAALTPMYFRFTGINTAQKIVVGPAVPRVELEPAAAGKFIARKVTAVGFGLTEAQIAVLTLS